MQRATRIPSRFSWVQTSVGPVDLEVVAPDTEDLDLELLVAHGPGRRWTLLGHPIGIRGDLHPCSVSTRQIGSTPNRGRCSSMKATTAAVAGRLPREESRGRLQDLIGPAQLEVLLFSSFIRARSSVVSPGRSPASVSARLTHCPKCLVVDRQLRRDRLDGLPLRGVLALVIEDHPHCPFPDLRRIRTSSRLALLWQRSILSREGAVTSPGAVHSLVQHYQGCSSDVHARTSSTTRRVGCEGV